MSKSIVVALNLLAILSVGLFAQQSCPMSRDDLLVWARTKVYASLSTRISSCKIAVAATPALQQALFAAIEFDISLISA